MYHILNENHAPRPTHHHCNVRRSQHPFLLAYVITRAVDNCLFFKIVLLLCTPPWNVTLIFSLQCIYHGI